MSRVHVWAAALLAAAVLGFTPGARGEPCLEVTGATNAVGDDHTCALWAKGKYLLQDDEEVENGRPVWHREESHVHQWGVVVSFPVLQATVEDCRRMSCTPGSLDTIRSTVGCLAPGRRGHPPRVQTRVRALSSRLVSRTIQKTGRCVDSTTPAAAGCG